MPSSLPAIATDRTLDEDGNELCSSAEGCSAGAAMDDDDDDTASVAKKSEELEVSLIAV